MEDKIEVNEYVRTDRGEIAKVTSVAKETLGEILGANEYRSIGFLQYRTICLWEYSKTQQNNIRSCNCWRLCKWKTNIQNR